MQTSKTDEKPLRDKAVEKRRKADATGRKLSYNLPPEIQGAKQDPASTKTRNQNARTARI